MDSVWLVELCALLYASLLRAAPGPFREACAGPMEQTFRTLCRAAWRRRGSLGVVRQALPEYVDLARTLLRQHAESRGVSPGDGTGSPEERGCGAGAGGSSRSEPGGTPSGGPPQRPTEPRRVGRRRPGELTADLVAASLQMIRGLTRRPTFTVTAVLTVALGVGVNSAIFSVVDAVLWRPLPYAEADELVSVWQYLPEQDFLIGLDGEAISVLRGQEAVFDGVEGYDTMSRIWRDGVDPEVIAGAWVTPGLFDLLGVAPLLGRGFRREEGRAGTEPVIVLSEGLWRERFGGDPEVLGRTVRVGDGDATVVGVVSARFRYTGAGTRYWMPAAAGPGSAVADVGFDAVGRLRPGLTPEAGQRILDARAEELQESRPRELGWTFRLIGLVDSRASGETRQALLALAGAVALVLLIACANVANLSLARATGRRREDAIRAALGAGRWGVARRALGENLLVGLAGGVLGIALAAASVTLSAGRLPARFPDLRNALVQVDLRVAAFTLAAALLVGLLSGLVPALRTARRDPRAALSSAGRGAAGSRRQRRLRGGLVAVEVALCMVLLVGAALLIHSFVRLGAVEPGHDTEGLLVVGLQLPEEEYPDPASQRAFLDDLSDRLRQLPAVAAVAVASGVPPEGGGVRFGIQPQVRGQPPTQEPGDTFLGIVRATPGYFRTLGIPLREGRAFEESDRTSSVPVMIVGETVARRYWGEASPVGSWFRTRESEEWHRVVGVAADVKQLGLDDRFGSLEAYYPLGADGGMSSTELVVRTDGDAAGLVNAVREQVRALDPGLPLRRVAWLEDLLWASLELPRFYVTLMSAFALLAGLLAAVGIYGVLSYGVARRTREIGVRLALGAGDRDVLGMVLRQGMMPVALGIVAGALGARWLTRFLESLLFDLAPTDPASWIVTAALLTVVGLLACWVPARRAVRVDPLVALRGQ